MTDAETQGLMADVTELRGEVIRLRGELAQAKVEIARSRASERAWISAFEKADRAALPLRAEISHWRVRVEELKVGDRHVHVADATEDPPRFRCKECGEFFPGRGVK